MKQTVFRASLDIHEIHSQFTLAIKKGDTSGRLVITLMENGHPYPISDECYAVFAGTKESGATLHHECIIQNNTIIYDFREDTTSSAGKIQADVILYGEYDTVVVSPSFTIAVHDSVYSEEEVESSQEFTSLTGLIVQANTLIKEVSTKLNNGDFVGEKGDRGEQGEQGIQGEKGDKPVITIGANGHWYVDGVDTGRSASGGGEAIAKELASVSRDVDQIVTELGMQGDGAGTPLNPSQKLYDIEAQVENNRLQTVQNMNDIGVIDAHLSDIEEMLGYDPVEQKLSVIDDHEQRIQVLEETIPDIKKDVNTLLDVLDYDDQEEHSRVIRELYESFYALDLENDGGMVKSKRLEKIEGDIETLKQGGGGDSGGVTIDEVNEIISNYNTARVTPIEITANEAKEGLEGHITNHAYKVLEETAYNSNILLTDDEKTAVCDKIGALKTTTSAISANRKRVYGIDKDGKQEILGVAEFGTPINNFLVPYGGGGAICCSVPTAPGYAANKTYVDNLPDYLTLTEAQKAKWKAWLQAILSE